MMPDDAAGDMRVRTAAMLNEMKRCFHEQPDAFKISVHDENGIVASLCPVSEVLGENEAKYVRLLSEWRRTNWRAYPTVFKVTEEGTRRWIRKELIEREDRILFMIVSPEEGPVGHMGLSNFNYSAEEAEIDNVVRGVHDVVPGLMTFALNALVKWSFEELRLRRLFLRVFVDNERSVRFYERCGFRGLGSIPLHKIIGEDAVKYVEIREGMNWSADREFYLMELLRGHP